jgi:16S rRNA (cytosine967-C5)-methyltransferase
MTAASIMPPRAAAARVLRRVVGQGESLSHALMSELTRTNASEHALVKELCYGTLRWHERLNTICRLLLKRPFRLKDLDIACLLELGLYQLIYMHVPAHACVFETVQTADALNKPWAKGIINAILRTFERQRSTLLERADQRAEIRFSHPQWLFKRIQQAYPEDWQRICEAANQHPPMTLRINRSATTREAYLRELKFADLPARAHPVVATAINLERPVDVQDLPRFAEGIVSVQDAAAQLAAPLLDCRPGMRVLDACAAPGGKAAHILESVGGDAELIAVEINAGRAERLKETLMRGNWQFKLYVADATRSADWWDGRFFDRILLDAPCSGTGVIRRHPDIKLLRRPHDVIASQALQLQLLRALWPLLEPTGMLLYATCSILPEENAQAPGLFATECGTRLMDHRQILPGDHDMDGFYYARLPGRIA